MTNSADESDGMDLKSNQYVTADNHTYLIRELLGVGGYGAVYRVVLKGTDQEFALKAEKKLLRREHSKLNMEVHILKAMSSQPEDKSHFAKIYDRCKKKKFYFIVMTLLGESLSELKKRRHRHVFSLGTGYAAAIQCLEAIEELHKLGFIHRDLKPGNYAIGLLPNTRGIIYLLDFGISRRILNEKNEIKGPRIKVPFKGTVRFAALASHKHEEQGFKDDCESWIYMLSDMCNCKGVPWKLERDKDKVRDAKERCKTPDGKAELFYGMALLELGKSLDYLYSLHYADKVDYNYLYRMLKEGARNTDVSLLQPFDWEREILSTDDEPSSNDPGQRKSRHTRTKTKSRSIDK